MRRDHRPYWLHRITRAYESFYVRRFIAPQLDAMGQGCRFAGPRHVHLSGPNISFGDDVHSLGLADRPVRLAVWRDPEHVGFIKVGDYSIINPGVRVTSAEGIEIGRGCMLAMDAYVTDADWHGIDDRALPPGTTGPVTLEDNVWIADGAMVAKGVTVGENSIVGARSVVTRDVPPNSVVAGAPARVVSELDPDARGFTRSVLFALVDYDEFEQSQKREELASNSLWGWLRSLIRPRRRE